MKYLLFSMFISVAGIVLGQQATSNPPQETFSPSLSLGARFSDDVQEFTGDYLLPIQQEAGKILMLNLRGFAVEDRAQEFNLGLIYRKLINDDQMILGLNTYYDGRNTEEDNYFSQLGAGAEVLSKWADFRANYYLPISDTKQGVRDFSTEDISVSRTSTRVTTTTTTTKFRIYEEAMEGFDVEAGLLLPFLPEKYPTRIFAGYYAFNSDYSQDREGFRARLEAQICPMLTFDAEWYEDDELNGTDYFVGFRFHVPLGSRGSKSSRRAGRLQQAVYRDFHIRTAQTGPEIIETTSTQQIQNIEPEPEPEPAPAPPPRRPRDKEPKGPNCEGQELCCEQFPLDEGEGQFLEFPEGPPSFCEFEQDG